MGIRLSTLQGIHTDGSSFYTKNAVEGVTVYTERLVTFGDEQFRQWDPKKSKLGAALKRGVSQIGIKPQSSVLYLGCSTGTTVSHVSDIIGFDTPLYALDVAPRVLRDLLYMARFRPHIIPIMADASIPQQYTDTVGIVDVVFMDIAQKNQVDIFLRNCQIFLKPGGFGLLAIKARSIDVTEKPKNIFAMAKEQLEAQMTIVDFRTLEPFEIDHAFFVVKKNHPNSNTSKSE